MSTNETGNGKQSAANVCFYKHACKICTAVQDLEQRPAMCVEHKCIQYTPCPKCKRNKTLDAVLGICEYCKKEADRIKKTGVVDMTRPVEDGDSNSWKSIVAQPQSTATVTPEQIASRAAPKISPPGKPPENYSPEEKEYYLTQWEEYKGFYRDPTAYSTVHQVIILEIELNWLTNFAIGSRGSYNEAANKQREAIIKNLAAMKAQLPSREATEMSQDDKSLCMIFSEYVNERSKRDIGGYRQIISPQAIALAPMLPYGMNLQELLQRVGYTTKSQQEVLAEMKAAGNMPADPRDVARLFGFPIDEKYALTDQERLLHGESDEDGFELESGDNSLDDREQDLNSVIEEESTGPVTQGSDDTLGNDFLFHNPGEP